MTCRDNQKVENFDKNMTPNTYLFAISVLVKVLQQDRLPKRVVRDSTQIRQWLFWRASLLLSLGQEVTKVDEQSTKSLSLVLWHGHDTTDIVLLGTMLLLGEVSDQVAALRVVLGQDVEQEGLDVVVEGLVIKKELDQETEILAIDLVGIAIDLVY